MNLQLCGAYLKCREFQQNDSLCPPPHPRGENKTAKIEPHTSNSKDDAGDLPDPSNVEVPQLVSRLACDDVFDCRQTIRMWSKKMEKSEAREKRPSFFWPTSFDTRGDRRGRHGVGGTVPLPISYVIRR